MSELLLDYGDIKDAIKAADKAADYIFDYTKELQKKIINEIDDLKKGASNYTNNVVTATKREISKLDKTSGRLTAYHDKLDSFLNGDSGAKKTDEKVSKNIKTKSETFRRDHGMNTNCVQEFFAWLSAEILDKSAFGQWLKKAFTTVSGWLDDFKYWFELEGGKYIIGAIGAAIVAVAAAVLLVVFAWPALLAAGSVWAWIVAAAGVVTSIIMVADSITNCVFDAMAYSKSKTDAAWANRYDSFNTLDTFLEKYRFDSAGMNRFSYGAAITIKVTNTVCTVINLVDMAINATQLVKLMKKNPKSIFGMNTLKGAFKDGYGKVTFGSIKYGLQTLYGNFQTIISQISTGNFMRYQNTLFKGKFGSTAKIIKDIQSYGKAARDISDKGYSKYSLDKTKKKSFIYSRYKDIKGIVENITGIGDISEKLKGFPADSSTSKSGSSIPHTGLSGIVHGGGGIHIPQIPTITPIHIGGGPAYSGIIYPSGAVPIIAPGIGTGLAGSVSQIIKPGFSTPIMPGLCNIDISKISRPIVPHGGIPKIPNPVAPQRIMPNISINVVVNSPIGAF